MQLVNKMIFQELDDIKGMFSDTMLGLTYVFLINFFSNIYSKVYLKKKRV